MTDEIHNITEAQRLIVNQSLVEAAMSDDRATFELCLQKGADLNARYADWYNRTPLMIAASCAREAQTVFLLAKGADLFLRDRDGKTAFDLAKALADSGQRKKITLLLLAALPDGPGAPLAPEACAPEVSAPIDEAQGVETGKDISVSKPLEINRRKKSGGSLQL